MKKKGLYSSGVSTPITITALHKRRQQTGKRHTGEGNDHNGNGDYGGDGYPTITTVLIINLHEHQRSNDHQHRQLVITTNTVMSLSIVVDGIVKSNKIAPPSSLPSASSS